MSLTRSGRRPLSSFGFQRLPGFFSPSLLEKTGVVIVDRIPVPPLTDLGLPEFSGFEEQSMSGITYQDTYFVEKAAESDELLHFHELVHVIQWDALGPDRFLLLYALGLAEYGYRECPLEEMAYRHMDRFQAGEEPYDVEREVREEIRPVE
jgi:hypothetical protein